MLYPLKLKPVYKPKPWGGKKFFTYFGRRIPEGDIGESWELCCRPDGMSVVENGECRGQTVRQLMETLPEKLLGSEIYKKYGLRFPLLIKILDAEDRLSVQVHPDDACAVSNGLKNGKDEMWYIVDAKENAKLIYGLKSGTSRGKLERAIKENRILQLLQEVTVKSGDFISIPAGTVHALLGGILAAEIQQNSNTTYRLYDWDRTDPSGRKRELHIPQALQAIHFEGVRAAAPAQPAPEQSEGAVIRKGPCVKEFRVDELQIHGAFDLRTSPEGFQVVTALKGNGRIRYDGGSVEVRKGDTVLIPAAVARCRMEGDLSALLTHLSLAQ